MCTRVLTAAFATSLVFAPIAAAQEMSFQPDYVGQNAFNSTQDRILESNGRKVVAPDPAARGKVAVDPARLRALMDAHRAELAPEYARRVRVFGREEANAWLRAQAAELGRRDGEAMRRSR